VHPTKLFSGRARESSSPLSFGVSPMIVQRAAVTLAFTVLSGCVQAPSPPPPRDLMSIGNRIFRLGCPSTAEVADRKVRNPHQPTVIDTIKTISCDGIELSTYIGALASDPTGLPIYVEVRRPHKELPSYMNVGESLRGLLDVLGKPSEQNNSSVTYRVGEVDDSVKFSVRDGRITSVRWDWYLD